MDDRSAEVAADIYRKIRKDEKNGGEWGFHRGSICIADKLPLATTEDFELLKKFGLELVLVG